MICFIAIFVFGVLGIFSATHRKIAIEAFNCVFRKVTLRKCDTGLDTRLKSQITGRLLRFSPKLGRLVFKNFQVISWIFTIIFVWSLVSTSVGAYNYYLYGNCNGPQEDGFCIFDPLGEHSKVTAPPICSVEGGESHELSLDGMNTTIFPTINRGAENQVVFIGCFGCQYTREVYPAMKRLMGRDDVEFVWAHFPVKAETDYLTMIGNCVAKQVPEHFIDLNDFLYETDQAIFTNKDQLYLLLEGIGIERWKLDECSASSTMQDLKERQFLEIEKTGIYGTPLVFVNGEPVVGPKPYRVYSRLLR